MDPPSRFHCTLAPVPRDARPTCWPDDEPPTLRPACTPGVMLMICHGSRAVGIFSRISDVNVAPDVVFFVSTTGAAAETVSSSDIAPTSSFMSTGALKPLVITMLLRTTFLKPLSSNVTENVPFGTVGIWYAPLLPVTTTSGACSAGPVTVTVTPGSTPPEVSVAFPKIDPCARAAPVVITVTATANSITRKTRIILFLLNATTVLP